MFLPTLDAEYNLWEARALLSILSIVVLTAGSSIWLLLWSAEERRRGDARIDDAHHDAAPERLRSLACTSMQNGNFFVNAMHPDEDKYRATIGVINGIDWNDLPENRSRTSHRPAANRRLLAWHSNVLRGLPGDPTKRRRPHLKEGLLEESTPPMMEPRLTTSAKKPDYNAFVPVAADGSRRLPLHRLGRPPSRPQPIGDRMERHLCRMGCVEQQDAEPQQYQRRLGFVLR